MSDDGDHLVVAGRIDDEPGTSVPGSRRSRRHNEDDGLTGPGVEDRPKLKRQRAPKTMYERWQAVVEPVLFGTPATARVGVPIFNRHVKEMRDAGYSDAAIVRGFQAFAEAVEIGLVTFRRPTAWFAFYGQRERFLTYDTAPLAKKTTQGPLRRKTLFDSDD